MSPDRMVVLWSENDKMQIGELVVCEYHEQQRWTHRLNNSRGACLAGWLERSDLDTPPGLSVMFGFASPEIREIAIREFAKVDGQQWAKELLKRLGHDDE